MRRRRPPYRAVRVAPHSFSERDSSSPKINFTPRERSVTKWRAHLRRRLSDEVRVLLPGRVVAPGNEESMADLTASRAFASQPVDPNQFGSVASSHPSPACNLDACGLAHRDPVFGSGNAAARPFEVEEITGRDQAGVGVGYAKSWLAASQGQYVGRVHFKHRPGNRPSSFDLNGNHSANNTLRTIAGVGTRSDHDRARQSHREPKRRRHARQAVHASMPLGDPHCSCRCRVDERSCS